MKPWMFVEYKKNHGSFGKYTTILYEAYALHMHERNVDKRDSEIQMWYAGGERMGQRTA